MWGAQGSDPLILAPDTDQELSIGDVAGMLCDVAGYSGKLEVPSPPPPSAALAIRSGHSLVAHAPPLVGRRDVA